MPDNIVERLLRGSTNIDKMRREIKQVFQILTGLLDEEKLVSEQILQFPAFRGRWEICRRKGIVRPDYLHFILFTTNARTYDRLVCDNFRTPTLADTQMAYGSLTALVEGLVRQYPQLQLTLSPLLKAAE